MFESSVQSHLDSTLSVVPGTLASSNSMCYGEGRRRASILFARGLARA